MRCDVCGNVFVRFWDTIDDIMTLHGIKCTLIGNVDIRELELQIVNEIISPLLLVVQFWSIFFTQATDNKVSSICMFWSTIDYLHVQYNNVFTRQIVDTISLNSTFNQFWSSKTFPYHCWNKMCSWRKLTTEASLYVFFSSTVCQYNISEKAALRSVFKYTYVANCPNL